MIRKTISFFARHPLLLAFILIASVFTVKTEAASAACGISTGNPNSYAGAIIEMYWFDDGGVPQNADNTRAIVTTIVGNWGGRNYSTNNNIVRLNPGNTAVIERNATAGFNQINGCGDGRNVVLGYTTTSPRDDGLGGPWALDCDSSIHGVGFEQPFIFTGADVPSGARAGGSWSTVEARAPNGFTLTVRLYYTQPPPAPPPVGPPPVGPPPANALIQGFKVPNGNGPVDNATITYIEGGGPVPNGTTTNSNSYYFNVYDAEHRVNAETNPPGWILVGYTLCINNTGCHGDPPTPSNSAYIDLRGGGYADLWWHYVRDEGYILGRVWNDLNGNGVDEGGEPFIQNPSNACGGGYDNVNTSVSISGYPNVNPGDSGNCNPEPFYIRTVATGNYNVSVNPPGGWAATTGTQNVNVGLGQYVDRHFGIWIPDQCPNKPGIQWPGLDPGDIKYGNNCFAITCDNAGFSFNPPNPSPGQPFSMRAGFIVNTYSGSVNYDDPSKDIRITNASGLVITSPNPQNYSPGSIPNGGAGYADFNVAGAPTGTYTIVWELSGTPATGCSNTVVVSNKPYFRAYGGDIIAGAGFKDSSGTCSVNGGKRQVAFNGLAGANYTGAGNSHGSFATGTIVDFVSGTLRPGGPNDPDMFAFTNQSGTYGGNFWTSNLGSACAPDYYGLKPASGLNNIATPFYSASSFGNGNYEAISGPPGGPRLIITGGTISPGTHATVYADGDVFIDDNIDYANSTSGYGNNPLSIPSLRVIARGNIYVGPNVTRLHGIFVAQPNGGAKGIFYTCGLRSGVLFRAPTQTLSGSTITSSELAGTGPGQCGQNKLNIYGSVNALAVKLLRTSGTVPNSAPPPPPPIPYSAVIQGENFTSPDSPWWPYNSADPGASNGRTGWIASWPRFQYNHTVSAGNIVTSLRLNVRGQLFNPEPGNPTGAPNMVVKVDGAPVYSGLVTNTSYGVVTISSLSIPSGAHVIEVTLSNDACCGPMGEDRNLFFDFIELVGGSTPPPATSENYNTGDPAERFIFTPDTWFNGQTSNTKAFQSYTALPPIL